MTPTGEGDIDLVGSFAIDGVGFISRTAMGRVSLISFLYYKRIRTPNEMDAVNNNVRIAATAPVIARRTSWFWNPAVVPDEDTGAMGCENPHRDPSHCIYQID